MIKKQGAFTLIELMVVVAIIAILAAMAVSNFSAAIKRARNAGRQADIEAVSKAMETCYDVPSGRYTTGITTGPYNATAGAGGTATGPFDSANNTCLNEDVRPGMVGFDYVANVDEGPPMTFVLCAQLEPVANWNSVGNSSVLVTDPDADFDDNCNPDGGTGNCFFCIKNQQ